MASRGGGRSRIKDAQVPDGRLTGRHPGSSVPISPNGIGSQEVNPERGIDSWADYGLPRQWSSKNSGRGTGIPHPQKRIISFDLICT